MRELGEALNKALKIIILCGNFVFAFHLVTMAIMKQVLPSCVRVWAYLCCASFWLAEVCKEPTNVTSWFGLLLILVLAWGEWWNFEESE